MKNKLNDNFWKWFGNSKVVNDDGTPKIVSHRSNNTFDRFDKAKISPFNLNGKGFYFSASDTEGKKDSYGKNIGYYYLKMENPVRKSDWVDRETLEKYFDPDVVVYIFNSITTTSAKQGDKVKWVMVIFSLWNYRMDFGKDLHVEEVLKKMGYDGIIDDEIEDTYVVFEPEQIKSVDNNGMWSNSDNIYERFDEAVAELAEETLPELNDNFWNWFGDSVVKDEDGNPLICFHGSTLDIDVFDTNYSGANTGNNEERVFYFTSDRELAVSYSTEAVIRQKEIPYYDKEEGTEYETWEEFEEYLRKEVCKTPHINPCFLFMEKPYIYDADYRDFDPKLNYTLMSMIKGEIDTSHYLFDEELYSEIANEHETYDEETDEYIKIKDFDYDGIIIKNVRDTISPLVDKYCDEYIVWNPTQIKSIYNNGNWSWYSRNVFETLNRELERYL